VHGTAVILPPNQEKPAPITTEKDVKNTINIRTENINAFLFLKKCFIHF